MKSFHQNAVIIPSIEKLETSGYVKKEYGNLKSEIGIYEGWEKVISIEDFANEFNLDAPIDKIKEELGNTIVLNYIPSQNLFQWMNGDKDSKYLEYEIYYFDQPSGLKGLKVMENFMNTPIYEFERIKKNGK